jgi:hypothetical protein
MSLTVRDSAGGAISLFPGTRLDPILQPPGDTDQSLAMHRSGRIPICPDTAIVPAENEVDASRLFAGSEQGDRIPSTNGRLHWGMGSDHLS